MPTPAETTVLRLLSSIEIDSEATAAAILDLGNEGVTVLCEIALGTFPTLRPKMRLNAVSLLDAVNHPQARETMRMLLRDANQDVSVRAIRAAGRLRDPESVVELDRSLRQPTLSPIVAAETVRALTRIDSPNARQTLSAYEAADPSALPHRGAAVVVQQLRLRQQPR
jgi:HEAT repeat protein